MELTFIVKWNILCEKIKKLKINTCLRKRVGQTGNDVWYLQLFKSPDSKLYLLFEGQNKDIKTALQLSFYIIPTKKYLCKKSASNYKLGLIRLHLSFLKKQCKANKKIQIVGKVQITLDSKQEANSSSNKTIDNSKETTLELLAFKELQKDLLSMYDNQCLPDIPIRCGSEVFWAHKSILAARSATLAALLDKLPEDLKLHITDLTPAILKKMLRFIYTGSVEELTLSTASELLQAAFKYELDGLKNICIYYLKCNITIENVILVFSYTQACDTVLRFHVLKFISKHFHEIEQTTQWQNFKTLKPQLVADVLTDIIKLQR